MGSCDRLFLIHVTCVVSWSGASIDLRVFMIMHIQSLRDKPSSGSVWRLLESLRDYCLLFSVLIKSDLNNESAILVSESCRYTAHLSIEFYVRAARISQLESVVLESRGTFV
jgi:hypothetical protein